VVGHNDRNDRNARNARNARVQLILIRNLF